jgi:hypothetical protein
MDYLAFPLRIEPSGGLARSSGVEENLLHLLRIMFTTPARGWPGNHNFGLRDELPNLTFKVNVRQTTVKRMNNSLRDLGIDWVELKTIEIDPASNEYEPTFLLTLVYQERGEDIRQIKL